MKPDEVDAIIARAGLADVMSVSMSVINVRWHDPDGYDAHEALAALLTFYAAEQVAAAIRALS